MFTEVAEEPVDHERTFSASAGRGHHMPRRTLSLDYAYVDAHTTRFVEALARTNEIAPDVIATATGLSPAEVGPFFALFRATAKVVTYFSQGVNQSAQGTDKVNAIINLQLVTGRIGKPGAGPLSLSG